MKAVRSVPSISQCVRVSRRAIPASAYQRCAHTPAVSQQRTGTPPVHQRRSFFDDRAPINAYTPRSSEQRQRPRQPTIQRIQQTSDHQQPASEGQGGWQPFGSDNTRLRPRRPDVPQRDPDFVQEPSHTSPAYINPEDRFLSEYTINHQIEASNVLVKDVNTGKLLDMQSLRRLLSTLDLNTHCVRQLSRPIKSDPNAPAVVEIVEKEALRQRTRAKEQLLVEVQRQQRESKPKVMEINWAIASNDLSRQAKQLVTFLEKGKKVEVLLAPRKRQRRATDDEAKNVLKVIREAAEECGAKEIKKMEGKVGGEALLVFKKEAKKEKDDQS